MTRRVWDRSPALLLSDQLSLVPTLLDGHPVWCGSRPIRRSSFLQTHANYHYREQIPAKSWAFQETDPLISHSIGKLGPPSQNSLSPSGANRIHKRIP